MELPPGPDAPLPDGDDPDGARECVRERRDMRDAFVAMARGVVGGDIWGMLRIGYNGEDGDEINLGSVDYHVMCVDMTIAVGRMGRGYRIRLLEVGGEEMSRAVEWRAFITFMRHLYVKGCNPAFMCERNMMDLLQGVIDAFQRERGIALETVSYNEAGGKSVVLSGPRGRPFVEIHQSCRVRMRESGSRPWRDLCRDRGDAQRKGFMPSDDDGRGREPGDDARDDGQGRAPSGFAGQLFALDCKLSSITARWSN
jgi:hypothetical protein